MEETWREVEGIKGSFWLGVGGGEGGGGGQGRKDFSY